MAGDVALAMLHRDERWLLQLGDDVKGILHPGHWGLFGGHLERDESPEAAIQRELQEEIGWSPTSAIPPWFQHSNGDRTVHLFLGPLSVDLDALTLNEGQDLKLASLEQMLSGAIWSDVVGEHRPLAPGLDIVLDKLIQNPRA